MHRRTSDLPIVEVNWDDTEDTLGDIGVYGIHSGIVDLSDFFCANSQYCWFMSICPIEMFTWGESPIFSILRIFREYLEHLKHHILD